MSLITKRNVLIGIAGLTAFAPFRPASAAFFSASQPVVSPTTGTLPVAAPLPDAQAGAAPLESATPDAAQVAALPPRVLHFRHLHTGEKLEAVYWEKGAYVPDAVEAINKLLRDFRTNEQLLMDLALLDLLNDLRQRTSTREPYRIISAYRSEQTNETLREKSEAAHGGTSQVARKSLHTEGRAVDLRLPDVALKNLAAIARGLGRGGVGYYPDSDFVHVDVGRVRTWTGS